jgi:hypothetical protein
MLAAGFFYHNAKNSNYFSAALLIGLLAALNIVVDIL